MISDPTDAALIALVSGEIAWKLRNNVDTARSLLGWAANVAADHPLIREFTASHGAIQVADTGEQQAAADRAAVRTCRRRRARRRRGARRRRTCDGRT